MGLHRRTAGAAEGISGRGVAALEKEKGRAARRDVLSSPSPRSLRGEGRGEGRAYPRILKMRGAYCLAPHPKFAFSEFRPLPAKSGARFKKSAACTMTPTSRPPTRQKLRRASATPPQVFRALFQARPD